ncbi:hypothetical protein [Spiroplasma poulsonii]|uniref:hypothetical protein n=1 Tax=Spiroplasma poulsonii TaxID=2138 RepID=UPI001F4CD6F6|nr:hypothetical protein [Spiroplasma poulsonii]UNF61248.1 hypothetical protein MNU24_04855 [Spiroplasma poulsonii]
MTLLYWREYQTLIFILVKVLILVRLIVIVILWIEDILIKNSDFQQLAGKKH